MNLSDFVRSAPYPGRVVVMGRDVAGVQFALYALSGRSDASRQRSFRADTRQMQVYDTHGAGDDPLRHYVAARFDRGVLAIGNGDHIDGVHALFAATGSAEAAVEDVLPEPDPPIWTPRIGILGKVATGPVGGGLRAFGVARVPDNSTATEKHLLAVSTLSVGRAAAVKTYRGSTTEVVPDGVPVTIEVDTGWSQLLDELHDAIDDDVRVGIVGTRVSASGFDSTWRSA